MMASNHNRLLTISDHRKEGDLQAFSCWRLRWCAFCLVVATAMQASVVGSHLQMLYIGTNTLPAGAGPQAVGAVLLLTMLLVALWSLLSQLLLWSDAAVMKLPEHVRIASNDEFHTLA